MSRLRSITAIAAGVLVGMAAGILLSANRERLTVQISNPRNINTPGTK